MSTATAPPPAQRQESTAITKQDREISFVPLGERTAISLTIGTVRNFLAVKTRSGAVPNDQDIVKFMMLCKARELNPWVGDAYLTGYDSSDGPTFSLITAAQALLKRAEISPAYDGMESGVIVIDCDKQLVNRQGDLVLDGETLVGGWARCWRKDQSKPSFDSLKLTTYSTGRSRWAKDPAGMIVKCAEASALRKAFPTQLGGLYTEEEMQHMAQQRIDVREASSQSSAASLDALANRLTGAEVQATPAPLRGATPTTTTKHDDELQRTADESQLQSSTATPEREPGDDDGPDPLEDSLSSLRDCTSPTAAVALLNEVKAKLPDEFERFEAAYQRWQKDRQPKPKGQQNFT